MFYTRETDTQKKELVYESDKSIVERGILRVYVPQPSAPGLLLLRKNDGGREMCMHITHIQKTSLSLYMIHVIFISTAFGKAYLKKEELKPLSEEEGKRETYFTCNILLIT